MCDQAKSQSISRFIERRGAVTEETLAQVRRMVGECIGL